MHPRRSFATLGLLLLLGACTAGPISPVTRAWRPNARSVAQPERSRVRARLERRSTLRARPSVRMRNAFATTQHVFVDWNYLGPLRPGATTELELDAGTHTLTSADSLDPDRNPVSITEIFEPHFAYEYEIVAE